MYYKNNIVAEIELPELVELPSRSLTDFKLRFIPMVDITNIIPVLLQAGFDCISKGGVELNLRGNATVNYLGVDAQRERNLNATLDCF